jgi:CubicO group peptidase (beta-lactamase class C family)
MFAVERIAAATGETKRPLPPSAVLRYMIAQSLDFAPGSRFVYSNFGYSILGRVAESVTGAPYEDAVRTLMLEPLGLSDMRLGHTLPEDRPVEEADYYPKYVKAPSIFESSKREVPEPDGAFSLETMDAHGGWTATATSLVLFAGLPFLRPGAFREIVRPPDPPATGDKGAYCGLGWFVRPQQDGFNRWHTGSLPGTASLLVHTHDGMAWAAILNYGEEKRRIAEALDEALARAARECLQRG